MNVNDDGVIILADISSGANRAISSAKRMLISRNALRVSVTRGSAVRDIIRRCVRAFRQAPDNGLERARAEAMITRASMTTCLLTCLIRDLARSTRILLDYRYASGAFDYDTVEGVIRRALADDASCHGGVDTLAYNYLHLGGILVSVANYGGRVGV